ncbi:MAG: hypothetical protein KJN90_01045, partial [Gammaproteobacteria bacterium]|nr:hypothetical protein [Gammaproteobacteria bacterium]
MNRIVFASRQRRALLLPSLLLAFLSAFLLASQTLAETGDHHQAYLDALDIVTAAESRIGGEMTRISNGTVAHFDFLQHEHIELLRHARALHHPPTWMSAGTRDIIISQADSLLTSAESLELVIADFLRAQALLNNAVSNTLDLLATQPNPRLSNTDLDTLQQLAHAAGLFRTHNTSETREVLYAAFDKVASLDIDQTWQNELSVQKHLIRSNATEPAAAIGRLAESDV